MHVIDENPLTVIFNGTDLDILSRYYGNIALPQTSITYKCSDPSNNYALYQHNAHSWKHSASVTNALLRACVNTLRKHEKENTKAVVPSIDDIYQDISNNMSEANQHKLIVMLATNIGYTVVPEEKVDIDVIGLDKELPELDHEQMIALNELVKAHSYLDLKRHRRFVLNGVIPDFLKGNPEKEPVPEISTGGACDYYRVGVTHPMSKDQVPYIAECGDIMESLEMTYAEANMFKEIWRTATERTLGLKKAGNNAKRAAEKIVFFADRNYQQSVHGANLTDSRKVTK